MYSGNARPGLFALSASEASALVLIEPGLGPPGFFCTGTHIADGWVLSAAHCALGGGLLMRVPGSTDTYLVADTVKTHETADVMLAHFDVPSAVELGQVPLFDEDISEAWLGQRVMLAGYGEQRDGTVRELQFLTGAIADVEDEHVVVSGEGRSGACLGDSGGPILVVGDDGQARLLGELSRGDSSCLGEDKYVRADRIRSFAGDVIGPSSPHVASAACGSITEVGLCQANKAIYCNRGKVVAEPCGDTICSWSAASSGYRCVSEDEGPCYGLSGLGTCSGSVAARCEAGRVIAEDCATCAAECGVDPKGGRAVCVPM